LPVEHVVDEVAQRVRIGLADQQVLEGPLEPGAAEQVGGIADDVRERRIGVRARAEPLIQLRRREDLAARVEDRPAQQTAARRDHLRVVAASRQRRGLDHLPPHHAERHDREGQHQVEAEATHVGRDHADGSGSVPMALRWLIASSRPIMMKLARMLDPP
jgi:hypothetical protein